MYENIFTTDYNFLTYLQVNKIIIINILNYIIVILIPL